MHVYFNILKTKRICYIRTQSVPICKHCISGIKTNLLMLCKATFVVCPEIHTKHTNSCDHNVEFLNVKPCLVREVMLDK